MTTNTAKVQARISPDLKNGAEKIFDKLSLTTTDAIRLFFRQVELHQGLPFDVKVPNQATLKAIDETRNPESLETYSSMSEVFDSLDDD